MGKKSKDFKLNNYFGTRKISCVNIRLLKEENGVKSSCNSHLRS